MARIHKGSTNVYADLGCADADGMFVKAQLTDRIASLIKARRMTQAEAARLFGMTQPKVSAMLRGQFRGISEDRLMRCLTALGQNVQIVIAPAARGRAGVLSVAA